MMMMICYRKFHMIIVSSEVMKLLNESIGATVYES